MYLLEQTLNDNVWIANLLSASSIVMVIVWLFNKFIANYDKRLKDAELEAEEIKKNYNKKFEEVHEKIDETKDVIVSKIEKMNDEKMIWRVQQTKDIAAIQGDIRHIMDALNRKP